MELLETTITVNRVLDLCTCSRHHLLRHLLRHRVSKSHDNFGRSISFYGDTALIGAHGDDGNSQSKSGSVYVFTRSSTDNGMFTQQSKLHANDPARDGHFGRSVSLYGDTALIWARYDDDNSKSNSGSVYVFKAP